MSSYILTQTVAVGSLLIAGQGIGILHSILSAHFERNISKYLLAAFVVLNCVCFLVESLSYTHYSELPQSIVNIKTLALLEGGLFYLYVQSMVFPHFRLKWRHALYLWPLPFYVVLTHFGEGYIYLIASCSYYLILMGYLIASARTLPGYDRFIRSRFSSIENISLGWLYKLVFIYLISSVILWLDKINNFYVLQANPEQEIVYIPNTFIFLVNFYLIAKACRQRPLTLEKTTDRALLRPSSEIAKYELSSLDDKRRDKIQRQLESYMCREEPYLDENLTASQLAQGAGISPHQLSQVLNLSFGQNFYEYVNGYRIEKACHLLEHQPSLPVLDIGVMAGFANKTTFYKHFKKRHAVTPLQYKKSCTVLDSTLG